MKKEFDAMGRHRADADTYHRIQNEQFIKVARTLSEAEQTTLKPENRTSY